MSNIDKREIKSTFMAFILGLILGGVGLAIMLFREVDMADCTQRSIKPENIERYAAIGSCGYAVQMMIICYYLANL